jgi:HB1/ASXL restriction endonuclease-like protein with HTH domain
MTLSPGTLLALSDRLKKLIESTSLDDDPLLVSNSAKLLAEVQHWEARGNHLKRRVEALESSTESRVGPKSLADWAYEVLQDEGAAMPYREIAAAIKTRGFKHAREPKNPERQLSDSVWTAMYEDERFTKVGRGVFDLAERQ